MADRKIFFCSLMKAKDRNACILPLVISLIINQRVVLQKSYSLLQTLINIHPQCQMKGIVRREDTFYLAFVGFDTKIATISSVRVLKRFMNVNFSVVCAVQLKCGGNGVKLPAGRFKHQN